ncbi:MAG: hypothetical protein V2J24_10630 [Pseudomonadales bacterium]|nr:hypothetical protein [Pseudomonadales bacterium]
MTLLTLGRRRRRTAWPLPVFVACGLFLADMTATASPISSFSVGLEARATDNVLRAPTDERSDTIFLPEAAIGLEDRWDRIELEADYRYRARRFRRDSFPNDQIVTGTAEVGVQVVPERYRIALGHERRQTLQDPQLADTPFNQIETDLLSLTQELLVLSTPLSSLAARGVLTRASGALPADESDRATIELVFDRRIDSRTTLGVAAEFLDVDFELAVLPDFDRRSVFARLGRSGRNWTLDLGVGQNEIRRAGFDSSSGFAGDLAFEWTPTARITARLSAARQLSDQAAQGAFAVLDPDAFLTPAEFDGLVFEDTSVNLDVSLARERFELFASLGAASQDFEDSDQEFQTTSASVGLSYRLRRAFRFYSSVRWSNAEFEDGLAVGSREDEQRALEIGLAWEPGPRTQVGLSLFDERRDSSDPGPAFGEAAGGFFIFDEQAIVLRLSRSLL